MLTAGTRRRTAPHPRPGPRRVRSRRISCGVPGPFTAEQDGYPAATLSLTVLTLVSSAGLLRVFTNDGWVGTGPVTAVALHAIGWAARRWRVPRWWPRWRSVADLWLLAGWTVLRVLDRITASRRRDGRAPLDGAGYRPTSDFAAAVTPVTTTTGYTLMAVLGTGAGRHPGRLGCLPLAVGSVRRCPRVRLLRGLLHPRRGAGTRMDRRASRWRPSWSSWSCTAPRSDAPTRPGSATSGPGRPAGRCPGRLRGAAPPSLVAAIVFTPLAGGNRRARHLRLAGRVRRRRLRTPPGTQPHRGPAHPSTG